MTVAELRLALEMLPDDLPVYVQREELAGHPDHLNITTVSHEVDNATVRLYLEDEAVVL